MPAGSSGPPSHTTDIIRPSAVKVTRPTAFPPWGDGRAAPAASRAVAWSNFKVPTMDGWHRVHLALRRVRAPAREHLAGVPDHRVSDATEAAVAGSDLRPQHACHVVAEHRSACPTMPAHSRLLPCCPLAVIAAVPLTNSTSPNGFIAAGPLRVTSSRIPQRRSACGLLFATGTKPNPTR
jgi:hypothetical protein